MASGHEYFVCCGERKDFFVLENDEAFLNGFAGDLAVRSAADVVCNAGVGGWAARVVYSTGTNLGAQYPADGILDALLADFSRCDEFLHAVDERFCGLRDHGEVDACVNGVADGFFRCDSCDESWRVVACGSWCRGTFDAFPVGDNVAVESEFGFEDAGEA